MTLRYETRRGEIEAYFDRTAVEAWSKLTSDAPVGRIRGTVRAGRDAMRATVLGWLPRDLTVKRVLDAGCGPGQLAIEAARRGANVVGVDLSATLIGLAAERLPADVDPARVAFYVGDMLDPAHGAFDHVVTLDTLIHYPLDDMAAALGRFAERTASSIVFTFAPRTPLLAVMHATGRLFPRANRSPAIEPIAEAALRRAISRTPALAPFAVGRTHLVSNGFYISHAMELVRR
jgi:magnesium-protoporphyrin O-methyltransferase